MNEKFEPLRVCQPCVMGKRLLRFAGRFVVVLILTIGVLLLPTPEGLSSEGHRAFAAAIFTGSLLALQLVSLPIVGLMVPLGLVALGLTNSTQSFEPFSRPIIFLVLGSLFIAEALKNPKKTLNKDHISSINLKEKKWKIHLTALVSSMIPLLFANLRGRQLKL